MTGAITSPVMSQLGASTFAMQRIVDPNAYPDAVIDCEKTPGQPLDK